MKKLIALLLAVVMVLGLAACATKTETPATDTPATDTPAASTETETKTDTISPNGENKSPLSSPQGERFDRFWALYPNKTGKKKARESWEKLKPSEELTETILNAVSKQKLWPKWQKDGGQYIPNPATWLNQGRWEDEPPEGGEDPYAKFT